MRTSRRPACTATLFACQALLAALPAHGAEDPSGAWRIQQAVVAPWRDAGMRAAEDAPVGASLRLDGERMEGPGVLTCGDASIAPTRTAAGGLFQGNLPPPAEAAAERLGIAPGPVAGVSVACDGGVFEFHRPEDDVLLLALDDRILTLSRSAGALAASDAPEAAVQALLERHFAGDMGFSAAALARKRGWLSDALARSIDGYLARHAADAEPPPVNGDPFTDSQEQPTRFVVRAAQVDGARASVPVEFADAHQRRRVDYRMARDGVGWRLVDLAYPRGELLSAWLRE